MTVTTTTSSTRAPSSSSSSTAVVVAAAAGAAVVGAVAGAAGMAVLQQWRENKSNKRWRGQRRCGREKDENETNADLESLLLEASVYQDNKAAAAPITSAGTTTNADERNDGGAVVVVNNNGHHHDDRIYLDYNGTTPIYPAVLRAMLPYLTTHYGNPSSGHWGAVEPRRAVARARRQILEHLLGIKTSSSSDDDDERDDDDKALLSSILFTSCGTESDNLAIQLALLRSSSFSSKENNNKKKEQKTVQPHVVSCNVEHPAIGKCLQVYQERGLCTFTAVPVQDDGRVLAEDVIDAVEAHAERTVLVTLMLANNESGALQPVREVGRYCRRKGILFHTDAAQAAGKVDLSSLAASGLDDDGGCCCDMISLVGHKIGAPKGIACLYVRPGCLDGNGNDNNGGNSTNPGLLIGGGQEFGYRGGTENVAGMVAMGAAAELAGGGNLKKNAARMENLRSRLLERLIAELGKDAVMAHGPADPGHRLPNTLSVGIKGAQSGALLSAIGHKVAASAGATCHSADSVSSVLKAMRVPLEYARGTLRLSVGPTTTADQVDRAADLIIAETKRQLNI